jgi:hypothetical protein
MKRLTNEKKAMISEMICEEYLKLPQIENRAKRIISILENNGIEISEKMEMFAYNLSYFLNDFSSEVGALEQFKIDLFLNEFATNVVCSYLPNVMSSFVSCGKLNENEVVNMAKQYERFANSQCYVGFD